MNLDPTIMIKRITLTYSDSKLWISGREVGVLIGTKVSEPRKHIIPVQARRKRRHTSNSAQLPPKYLTIH